jgi:Spy/CpxP family protein refolding chaperone
MTNRRKNVYLAGLLLPGLLLGFTLPAGAQPGMGPPRAMHGRMGRPLFLNELFRPETVMKHQSEIQLTDEQRAAITEAIKTTQGNVLDLQWKLEEQQQKLSELLAPDHIDMDAALAQADVVMDAERKVKEEHLTLLIKIKNLLTPEQQKKLREWQSTKKRRPGPPAAE